ncbi:hypothetical protein H6G65_13410 [Microcystis elabens FACHB-917]|nr:hypothetical protein [Microcystis elabens FACHB-917]
MFLLPAPGLEQIEDGRRDDAERLDRADADDLQNVAGQTIRLASVGMAVLKTVDNRQQPEGEHGVHQHPEREGAIQ